MINILGRDDGLGKYLAQEPGQKALPEGLSAEEASTRLKLLFSRGVCQAAIDMHSAIITAGVARGVVPLIGDANRDRGHRVPLIGVVAHNAVTWPGDTRSFGPGQECLKLDPNHTHLVMLRNTEDRNVRRGRGGRAAARGGGRQRDSAVPRGSGGSVREALRCPLPAR